MAENFTGTSTLRHQNRIKNIVSVEHEAYFSNDYFFNDGFIVILESLVDYLFTVGLYIDRRNPNINQDIRLPERFRLAWAELPDDDVRVEVGWLSQIHRYVVQMDWLEGLHRATPEIGERLRCEYFPEYR